MKKRLIVSLLAGFCLACIAPATSTAGENQEESITVPTIAVLPFANRIRGASSQGLGESVSEVLTAELSTVGEYDLADRTDITKIMGELKLSASGMVDKASQLKIGYLVGARIIITGSVFKAGKNNYIVAKIIGVETSKVVGCSIKGVDNPVDMISKLTPIISQKIQHNARKLLPVIPDPDAILKKLKEQIGNVKGTKVYVHITERAIVNIDPAAETEMKKLLLALGFDVVDSADKADFRITGEGLAENSGQFKQFFSATARVEINIRTKSDKLIASDRQVETVAGPAVSVAAKQALAQATLSMSERLIPLLKK